MAQQLTTPPAASPSGVSVAPAKTHRRSSGGINAVSIAILVVAMIYFLVPWLAAASYGFSRPGQPFTFDPLVEVFSMGRAGEALINTVLLTVATTILMLVILVPTIVFLNMKAPQLAKVAEMLSILPMVVPAVALVSGVSEFYRAIVPSFLTSIWSLVPMYVILVMPLCYRAIDAGVKALDLQTMFAASSSLGATTWTTLKEAVLPNLRVGMLSAALLCVAGVLGEFAMASLLLHYTFPVYMVEVSSSSPKGVAALSFIVTIITWLLLVIISQLGRTQSGRTSKGKK